MVRHQKNCDVIYERPQNEKGLLFDCHRWTRYLTLFIFKLENTVRSQHVLHLVTEKQGSRNCFQTKQKQILIFLNLIDASDLQMKLQKTEKSQSIMVSKLWFQT